MHHLRRPRSRPPWSRGAQVVLVTLLCTACGTTGSAKRANGDAPAITVTTTVMGDVVRNVAPETAEVTVLMGPGTDPHTFEPSARQLAALQNADLIVASGGGLEAGLQQALDDAAASGVPVFTAIDHVTPLESDDEEHGDEEHGDDEHEHGEIDPHFWMDPVRMADAVQAVGARIDELTGTPGRSSDRARRYRVELDELDARITALLDDLPQDRRTIVTNHGALAYFAERYDLHVAGTVIPSVSTGAEPSARDIQDLAEALRRERISTIFTDSTAPPQLAMTLAREVGPDTAVVELYTGSLGGDDGAPASYVDMLMTDAERINAALRR